MEIRAAQNGFILNVNGYEHVAKTLMEAAELVGEHTPHVATPPATLYADGYSVRSLSEVKYFAQKGEKITAIKLMRDMYTPRMSLLVAKELVEAMV